MLATNGPLLPLASITAAAACLAAAGPLHAQADGRWRDGEQVYVKVCGHCHESGVGPVLKGRGLPAEALAPITRHGLSAMPAFRAAEIDDQALQALGDYLAQTPAPKAAPQSNGGKP
ncbi:c-type cytochrome [Microvirga brassicacearum]|uniref:Cytochrome c n=1 Tax=Microvirga brassicacearum TaxID=2580413 RepID=A0A5N3P771_9HYPH|nr:cytochrome c [Microvirga brassicacearum]KAB0265574.1 cytochrome c [Microvirga brassicacearum]